jgi:hypothetical protein
MACFFNEKRKNNGNFDMRGYFNIKLVYQNDTILKDLGSCPAMNEFIIESGGATATRFSLAWYAGATDSVTPVYQAPPSSRSLGDFSLRLKLSAPATPP